ncbi:hypothetical protein [Butyrivibrio sp. WCD2001]|uniref:hypothetical protein n=1 Tax=Butyrivibrio sp. WCD2001 TaxID=1280681 RepID=UPI0004215BA2|nr:hypothetical protein [Butyrivibrio sp. WCD2001]
MKSINLSNNKYIITVSYGNYTKSNGGTDKVIFTHQKMLNDKGVSVIHLCPLFRIGMHFKVKTDRIWQILVDGIFHGYCYTEELCKELYRLSKEGIEPSNIFIHHLRDVNIDELTTIVKYIDVPIYFYLHDYMTVCCSAGLINDKEEFCGPEEPSDIKCANCSYRKNGNYQREEKTKEFLKCFSNRITFIAPSDAAKKVWVHTYKEYEGKVKTIYHQKQIGQYEGNHELLRDDEPLKIAFVGYQSPLKGWNIWKKAIEKCHAESLNEMFYQFGRVQDHMDFVEEVGVDYRSDKESMVAKLRDNGIHVAVLWSIWPETYSYTYYEASASNAFILTNAESGNMADQVVRNENGIVADNKDDLTNILLNEKALREKVNEFRRSEYISTEKLEENDDLLTLIGDRKRIDKSFDLGNDCGETIELVYYKLVNEVYGLLKRKK